MSDRVQLSDINFFLSLLAEPAVNTPYDATAEFVGAMWNPSMPPIPDVARSASPMVGAGLERGQKLRKGWVIPIQIPIPGDLNTETSARLGNRCLGGTRTPGAEIAVGSGVFDVITHCQTKAQGRIPKLSTVGFELGAGYKFIHSSCAVGSMEIAFEGENTPSFTANMVNTGHHKINLTSAQLQALGFSVATANALTVGAAVVDVSALDPEEHHLMHPAATKVTFSDGQTIDLADEGDLISGACGLDNQMVIKHIPGDPFLVPTNRKAGAVARDIHRSSRVPMARIKAALPADLRDYVNAQNGTEITSLTFLFRSEEPIGATAYFYEFEWKYPLLDLETVSSDPDGEDAATTLSFYGQPDPVTDGYVIQRVRTDNDDIQ